LKQSNLGRAILQFAELKSYTEQFDYSKLFDAIEELEASLKLSKDEENKLFDEEYKDYVEDVDFFSNQVTQYTTEVATHTEDLRIMNIMLDVYTETLQTKINDLSSTKGLKAELEEIMRKNKQVFEA
jgi:hypothetical protein